MIPVKVRDVVLDSVQNPLLLLVDLNETIVLPIVSGFLYAQAIVLKLHGHLPPRPMTHDLIKSLCHELGAKVVKIVVNDIKDNTFYAEIYLTAADRELVIDARPSDAVALALTVGCPIYLTDKVAAYTISLQELADQSSESSGDPHEGGPLHH